MSSETSYLMLVDTDQIQRYIFSTNRLREIRGASLLLERLNSLETPRLIHAHAGELIFAGGGGALATFRTEADADACLADIQKLYRQQTHLATITGACIPFEPGRHEKQALQQVRAELHLRKSGATRPQIVPANAYLQRCPSCNQLPVTHRIRGDDLCIACTHKRKEADATRAPFPAYSGYQKFAETAASYPEGQKWENLNSLPSELEKLADSSGYIAFVHADVNGLGSYLEQQNSLDGVKQVGASVENALREALVGAVYDVKLLPGDSQEWPFLILVMGGDDLTLAVPARKAVALANRICLHFGELIASHLNGKRELAVSAGVVIAKPRYPAYALNDLVEKLTTSAKRLSYQLQASSGDNVPTLDFQIVTTATTASIEHLRTQQYTTTSASDVQHSYTTRPLPCISTTNSSGMDDLLQSISTLRRAGFPRNKLNSWATLLETDEIERILAWQILQSRVGGQAKDALCQTIARLRLTNQNVFRQIAENRYSTPLLDLLELYEFAEGINAPTPGEPLPTNSLHEEGA